MASISLNCLFSCRKSTCVVHTKSFSMLVISCQCRKSKREKQINKAMFGVGKFGKGLKDSLSPKQKGDWKDLTLMSLSFALYVYIAQKLVCAYCVWTSLVGQNW